LAFIADLRCRYKKWEEGSVPYWSHSSLKVNMHSILLLYQIGVSNIRVMNAFFLRFNVNYCVGLLDQRLAYIFWRSTQRTECLVLLYLSPRNPGKWVEPNFNASYLKTPRYNSKFGSTCRMFCTQQFLKFKSGLFTVPDEFTACRIEFVPNVGFLQTLLMWL